MYEFKKIKLGEICERLSSGKSITSSQIMDYGTYPVYGGNGLRGYTSSLNFDGECVIIGRQGAYCGNVKFFKGKGYMTEHAVVVCANKENNTYFLGCVLSLMHLERLSHQSAQPGLSVRVLAEQYINLPSLDIQNRIATILSRYDSLIENYQKQIKLLEESAQRLYKEWFVDFRFPEHETTKIVDGIPEGWKKSCLGSLVEFKRGKTITKKEVIDGDIPVVAGGLEPAYYCNKSNTSERVVTISASGANAGYTRMYFEKVWASDCSFVDSSMTSFLHFVFCYLRDNKIIIDNMQKGSAQPHVYAKDINSMELCLPEVNILQIFENKVSKCFDAIFYLMSQIRHLTEARNRLLPKLMSGEIKL